MSLTDACKAGKLEHNEFYWIKLKGLPDIVPILHYYDGEESIFDTDTEVEEIIAPCYYEELQRLKFKLDESQKQSAYFEMKAYDLAREVAELRKLLGDCKILMENKT